MHRITCAGYQIPSPFNQSRSAKPVHCRLTAKDLARTEPHGHGDGEGYATRCQKMANMKDTLVCVGTASFEKKGSKDGYGPFTAVNLRVVSS